MKIQRIENQNLTYGAKRHFLTKDMKSSVESLLIRMNAETDRTLQGDYYRSTITKKLHYENSSFEDERRLTSKLKQDKQKQGFSILKIGNKTILDIDNKTGEIVDFIKPFYKPWFIVFQQAKKILSEMRTNFYDKELVKKEQLTIRELTPEGNKKMKNFVLQFEKQRLENIIKEQEKNK